MTTLKPSTSIFKTIVRAATPWAISAVVWSAQRFGLHVNAGTATEVSAVIGTSLTVFVPPLEKKWPWVGVFLGWIGAPTYTALTTKAALEAEIVALQNQVNAVVPPAPGTPVALTITPNV